MTTSGAPDKAMLKRELEETRAAYHALLAELPGDAWSRRSGNRDMLVKELMWHMAWSMTWLANGVDAVRSRRKTAVSRVPGAVADPLRKLAMRWLARRATPASAAGKYDDGHRELVAKLESVREDEWSLSTTRFGETRTMAWHFRQPVEHFVEHAADVRAVLGSAAPVS